MSLLGAQHIGVPLVGRPKTPGNSLIKFDFDAPKRLGTQFFNQVLFKNNEAYPISASGANGQLYLLFPYFGERDFDLVVNGACIGVTTNAGGPGLSGYAYNSAGTLIHGFSFVWAYSGGVQREVYNYVPSFSYRGDSPIFTGKNLSNRKFTILRRSGTLYFYLDDSYLWTLATPGSFEFVVLYSQDGTTGEATKYRDVTFKVSPGYTPLELERHFGKNRV